MLPDSTSLVRALRTVGKQQLAADIERAKTPSALADILSEIGFPKTAAAIRAHDAAIQRHTQRPERLTTEEGK